MIVGSETKNESNIEKVLNGLEGFRGRIYFPVELLDDDLLTELVTAKTVMKSSGYVEDLARSHGVEPEKIAEPTPYTIERIAEVFVYRETALKRTHGNAAKDDDSIDEYERKRQMYQKELECELAKVTAETFTGGVSARERAFPMSVPLYRG